MLALVLPISINAADTPSSVRSWARFNFTAVLSKNWAFTAIPGWRNEWSRSNTVDPTGKEVAAKGNFLNDFFAGPVYINKISKNLKFAMPILYFYMNFPMGDADAVHSHNLELVPILTYNFGNGLVLSNRIIFHKWTVEGYMVNISGLR